MQLVTMWIIREGKEMLLRLYDILTMNPAATWGRSDRSQNRTRRVVFLVRRGTKTSTATDKAR